MSLEEISASMSQSINELFGFSDPLYGELIFSSILLVLFLFLGWIVNHVFEHYFKKWAQKTKTKLDDEILKNVNKPIYVLVLFFGFYYFMHNISILAQYFDMTTEIFDEAGNVIGQTTKGVFDLSELFLLIEVLLVAYIFTRVTNVLFAWYIERQERKTKASQHILYVFRVVFNAVIYLIAFFVFMGLSGIDLTGLAIGGAATAIVIGFALQSILGDFFSAFSIYFDKPFEIGDFIIVGDYSGTVKKIGMKSTRVQLLQGEELVLSNKELTTASIRNFKKMTRRRIEFGFGVTYDTSLEKLKKIPDIIKSIINTESIKHVYKLDRVHFSEFGDFSLNFDVVYYLDTQDYNKYKDTQQEINFRIKESFEKEGIEMAFPTQTIFLNK
jgi:small-conductance mechanosensitive channel